MVDAKGVCIVVDGEVRKNPGLVVAEAAAKTITALGAKFGMTPADRERSKTAAPAQSNADRRLPPSQGGRPRRKAGAASLRVVAPEAAG